MIGLLTACHVLPLQRAPIPDTADLPAGRWLFLGDSITQAGSYVDYIETWLLLHEAQPPEIIDLGLSSETVSGLSEPDHPFPRPNLHNRLDKVLVRTRPDVVFGVLRDELRNLSPVFRGALCGLSRRNQPPHREGAGGRREDRAAHAASVCQSGDAQERRLRRARITASALRRKIMMQYWPAMRNGSSRSMEKDGVRALDVRSGLETYMEASYPKEPIHPAPLWP